MRECVDDAQSTVRQIAQNAGTVRLLVGTVGRVPISVKSTQLPSTTRLHFVWLRPPGAPAYVTPMLYLPAVARP